MWVNMPRRETNLSKVKSKATLKVLKFWALGVVLFVVAGYGAFWHLQASKYRTALTVKQVQEIKLKRENEKLRLRTLSLEELAAESKKAVLVKRGDVVPQDGFFLTRVEYEDCLNCVKFRGELDQQIGDLFEQNYKYQEERDKARRARKTWRTVAFVTGGVLVGVTLSKTL